MTSWQIYSASFQLLTSTLIPSQQKHNKYDQKEQLRSGFKSLHVNYQICYNQYHMIKNQNAIMGHKYYQEKKFAQAAIYFQKWIDAEPEVFKAYISKGIALSQNNQFEEALLEYQKAEELEPGNEFILQFRAVAKRNLGRDTEVIYELEKYITSGKKSSPIFYCLGRSYYNLQQDQKAEQNYLKAIEQNVEYYQAYTELGIMYRQKWKQRESIEYLSKAVEFSKDQDETVYIERAITYQQISNRWACLQDINKAILINPNSCWAFRERSHYYRSWGMQHERQKMDLDYAQKNFDKQQLDTWKLELSKFAEKFGMEKENKCLKLAIEDFKQVMKMEESRTQDSLFRIAEAELYLNHEAQAMQALKKLLQIDPEQSRTHELMFEVRLTFGRFEEAIQEYTKARSKGFISQKQYCQVILPYFKLGKFQEIFKMSSEAAKYEKFLEFYLHRGFSYLKTGEYVKAEEDFQLVLKYYQQQHMRKFQLAHFGIGMAAKKRGLKQIAEKEIAYVYKISEDFPLFYFCYANQFMKDWEKAKKAFDSGITLWKCYEELAKKSKYAAYKYQTNSEVVCMNKAIVEYLSLENCIEKLEERVNKVDFFSLLSSIEKLKKFLIKRVLFIIFQEKDLEEIEKDIGEEVNNMCTFLQAFYEQQLIVTERKKKVIEASSSEQFKNYFFLNSDVPAFQRQMIEKMTLKTDSSFHLLDKSLTKICEEDLTNKMSNFLSSKVRGKSIE